MIKTADLAITRQEVEEELIMEEPAEVEVIGRGRAEDEEEPT